MTAHSLRLFVSNRQEQLYYHLRQQLFLPLVPPFSRRIISVPHGNMRRWLQMQLAMDPTIRIATGFELLNEKQAINRILSFFPLAKDYPSRLEIALALEQALPAVPGFPGVQSKAALLDAQSRRRLLTYVEALTLLFDRYGCYGAELLKDWPTGELANWQRRLWEELFGEDKTWTYRCSILDRLDVAMPGIPEGMQVHFFCHSVLCPLHLSILTHLSRYCSVNLYMLSPCSLYWHDVLTGRERRRLGVYWEKRGASVEQRQQLDALIRDTNPLLAQLGLVGREMALQLEKIDPLIHNTYRLPAAALEQSQYAELAFEELQLEPTPAPFTLIQAVQADLLLLRNPSASAPKQFSTEDASIQLHAHASKAREIQSLYDTCLSIIDRHTLDPVPIQPCDILVLVSDLSTYLPFIKATFGSSGSRLNTQISDLSLKDQSPFIQIYLHLLSLAEGGWEAPALLHLFSSPFFRAKHQLNEEDVAQFQLWIQQAPIYWGENQAHRDLIMKKAHCEQGMIDQEAIGTWEYGLHRLLLSLVQQDPGSNLKIPFSEANLLNKLIVLVESLRKDLKPLREGQRMSLVDWSVYFECLCDAYLSPLEEGESSRERDLLYGHLKAFSRVAKQCQKSHSRCDGFSWGQSEVADCVSRDVSIVEPIDKERDAQDALRFGFQENQSQREWLQKDTFRFDSIYRRLDQGLSEHTMTQDEANLQSVHFCSFAPHRAISSRVIVLLGLDESLPSRFSHPSPLDLLQSHPKADNRPSDASQYRYLFLECLLSARDYLILNYAYLSSQDGKEQQPYLPVAELMTYLDAHYRLGDEPAAQAITRRHPFFPFDPIYFQPNSRFKSYSKVYFRASKVYCGQQKIESRRPLSCPWMIIPEPRDQRLCLQLRDLETAVRDPIKLHLNKTLGVYLPHENQREIKGDEPLGLSWIHKSALRSDCLTAPFDQVIAQARKRGHLPLGTLGLLAAEQLQQDTAPARALMKEIGPLMRLQLKTHCTHPQQVRPGVWHLPSIKLAHPLMGEIEIVGQLDRVSAAGLLVDGYGSFADAIKGWPARLLLLSVSDLFRTASGQSIADSLLFLEEGRMKYFPIQEPTQYLLHLVDHYFRCLSEPSPLAADWAQFFVQDTSENTATRMERDLADAEGGYRFRYFRWAFGAPDRNQLKPWVENWVGTSKTLYEPLANATL